MSTAGGPCGRPGRVRPGARGGARAWGRRRPRRGDRWFVPTVSKDTRVRAEGLVKIIAMVRPAKGLNDSSRA
jgi:hypothetical protein